MPLRVISNSMKESGFDGEHEPPIKIKKFDEIGKRISFEDAAKILGIEADQLRIISDFTEKEKATILRAISR